MGIGGSIFLIAVGAILSFAVDFRLGWVDINTVGWVLMLAGIAGLVLTLVYSRRSRTTVATGGRGRVVQQTEVQEPPL
ncbi:hypothetical protein GCM10010124_29890 [Pilimelia terevasa]|uniref:DUF6458 domain-containing protein n=1 Tax=Pilimelia terevasa TaxID=53372 RepID=A0A8J3BTQ1_9ACTN|nr:DUF6458 family protein [Pilimelia terevasa]GGK35214.1 hypothetical protein GCM10010124_29890 [Pilimelia terevasa]